MNDERPPYFWLSTDMAEAIKADPVWSRYWVNAPPEPKKKQEPTTAHLRRKRLLRP